MIQTAEAASLPVPPEVLTFAAQQGVGDRLAESRLLQRRFIGHIRALNLRAVLFGRCFCILRRRGRSLRSRAALRKNQRGTGQQQNTS